MHASYSVRHAPGQCATAQNGHVHAPGSLGQCGNGRKCVACECVVAIGSHTPGGWPGHRGEGR